MSTLDDEIPLATSSSEYISIEVRPHPEVEEPNGFFWLDGQPIVHFASMEEARRAAEVIRHVLTAYPVRYEGTDYLTPDFYLYSPHEVAMLDWSCPRGAQMSRFTFLLAPRSEQPSLGILDKEGHLLGRFRHFEDANYIAELIDEHFENWSQLISIEFDVEPPPLELCRAGEQTLTLNASSIKPDANFGLSLINEDGEGEPVARIAYGMPSAKRFQRTLALLTAYRGTANMVRVSGSRVPLNESVGTLPGVVWAVYDPPIPTADAHANTGRDNEQAPLVELALVHGNDGKAIGVFTRVDESTAFPTAFVHTPQAAQEFVEFFDEYLKPQVIREAPPSDD